jgi:hypothetical protein
MMDFIIVNMTLNSSEKEKNKTKAIEMKPRHSYSKKICSNTCYQCGQYLPWCCVCYINKSKK